MKSLCSFSLLLACVFFYNKATSQPKPKRLYIDVHRLEPENIMFSDTAATPDSPAVHHTHAEAHGLLPVEIMLMTDDI